MAYYGHYTPEGKARTFDESGPLYAALGQGDVRSVYKFSRARVTNVEQVISTVDPFEGFIATAQRMRIAAGGDAADSVAGVGARVITIAGLDENWEVIVEDVETAGASASAYTTNRFIRVFRVRVKTSGTRSDGLNGTNIGAMEIEAETGEIVAAVEAGNGSTLLSVFSVPAGEVAYITNIGVSAQNDCTIKLYKKNNSPTGDDGFFAKQLLEEWNNIKVRVSTMLPNSYIEVGPCHDFWLTATKEGSGNSTVTASYGVLLARKELAGQ